MVIVTVTMTIVATGTERIAGTETRTGAGSGTWAETGSRTCTKAGARTCTKARARTWTKAGACTETRTGAGTEAIAVSIGIVANLCARCGVAVVIAALATAAQWTTLIGIQTLLQELEAILVAQQTAGIHAGTLAGRSNGLWPDERERSKRAGYSKLHIGAK